jgi:hypothetical protein
MKFNVEEIRYIKPRAGHRYQLRIKADFSKQQLLDLVSCCWEELGDEFDKFVEDNRK